MLSLSVHMDCSSSGRQKDLFVQSKRVLWRYVLSCSYLRCAQAAAPLHCLIKTSPLETWYCERAFLVLLHDCFSQSWHSSIHGGVTTSRATLVETTSTYRSDHGSAAWHATELWHPTVIKVVFFSHIFRRCLHVGNLGVFGILDPTKDAIHSPRRWPKWVEWNASPVKASVLERTLHKCAMTFVVHISRMHTPLEGGQIQLAPWCPIQLDCVLN